MSDALYKQGHRLPYGTLLVVKVEDQGNGLPISIGVDESDPPRWAWSSMDVAEAKRVHESIGKAIEAAEQAGLS